MMPNRKTTRIGRTSANSVIVWPCSLLLSNLFFMSAPIAFPGALAARGGLPGLWPSCLRQQPRHVEQSVSQLACQAGIDEKDGHPADRAQRERVFVGRLSVFELQAVFQLEDQLLENHPSLTSLSALVSVAFSSV